MDDQTKQEFLKLHNDISVLHNDISVLHNELSELKNQTLQNCKKIDRMSKQLDGHTLTEIFDICTANGQGIETLSKRIDKIENN